MNNNKFWLVSNALSLTLLVTLIALWQKMDSYEVKTQQLYDQAAVDKYLQATWSEKAGKNHPSLVKIPTGILINTLKFLNSVEVNVTGMIWQRYTQGFNHQYKPKPGQPAGFILPEQVNSGGDLNSAEFYRYTNGNEETILWYFDATLRQNFDYTDYPFDHETVKIRILPRQFAENIILVPDFNAYDDTSEHAIFGIEDTLVLGSWIRENTYFNYHLTNLSTNLGIKNYIGKTGFPELHYNFVIKRKSLNAFITYLFPLLLIAALLFGSMLIVTSQSDKAGKYGFNVSGILGACTGLFFVVLIGHIQLRNTFASHDIVYLEWFYYLSYLTLATATANTFLFSTHPDNPKKNALMQFIHYRDNLLPKLLYWPVLLLCSVLITLSALHI